MSRIGLLCVALSLLVAESRELSIANSRCHEGMMSRSVDNLYLKVTRFKASVPEDGIKNKKLLKKKTKRLITKNCRFRDQLLTFYLEDVFGSHHLPVGGELRIVEDFQRLKEVLNRCVPCAPSSREMKPITKMKELFYKLGNKGVYKAIGELDILLPWIKSYIDNFK
ncbi:interleukin-26 [Ornithorhynchus anatinus]|uniref:Interleukin family protein n=1 Tax=Ornithorhynchus anatinus TaxID=9258 RepID=F6PQV8_ORNAN|nr:interleukin-26 [Ornithorhynchus anatinus]